MASAQAPASTRYSSSSTWFFGAGNRHQHAWEKLRAVDQQLEAVALHARERSRRPCQRAVKISTAPTGTDRLMADKLGNFAQRFQPGRQIEILGIDHHRLQRHHLKTPVIEPRGQQFWRCRCVACRAGQRSAAGAIPVAHRAQIVDRPQIDLSADQRFGKGLDFNSSLRMRSSRRGTPLLTDSSSTSTSALPLGSTCRAHT